jgi:hypothetical protein
MPLILKEIAIAPSHQLLLLYTLREAIIRETEKRGNQRLAQFSSQIW